jgi:D-sedoheptulose 7-phosphate isomerase
MRDASSFDVKAAVRLARRHLAESCRVKQRISPSLLVELAEFAQLTITALSLRKYVYLFGNGGSAADAQHIAAELQGRLRLERPGLRVQALTTNTSTLTAVANDYGFNDVFARQLESLAGGGDIAIGLTTSGVAQRPARPARGAAPWLCHCGFTGGRTEKIKSLADFLRRSLTRHPADSGSPHHLGHIYCDLIERHLFSSSLR